MSVAVIADCHLGGPGGEAGPLLAQLEALPERGCRRLVLLGDIFHVWVASPQFETAEIRAVMPCLERLRRQGIEVDYIEGNRDFFLLGSPYERFFDRVALEVSFTVGGQRYLAVHGDGLNDRDRQYLFWRWLSKSLLSRLFVRRLPTALARRVIRSTEGKLSKTNFKHRVNMPEEAILSYARRRLAEGYDRLLLGHFHEPRRWELPEGEVHLLDAWFNGQHVEWLGSDPSLLS